MHIQAQVVVALCLRSADIYADTADSSLCQVAAPEETGQLHWQVQTCPGH